MLLLIVASTHGVTAQKPDIKFGKVSKEELNMTVYPADSSAHAVILSDLGETEFRYDVSGNKGWQTIFTRHVRIKVLDKEGVSAGDFKLRLYHDGTSSREKLDDLDGITFNLENGKTEKSKLERRNVTEVDEDKNHVAYTFALPNVREGSVIDLRYTIKSDYLMNLQRWHFQRNIPVAWSEYNVGIPEYFVYKHTLTGYIPLAVNEMEEKRGSMTFTDRSGIPGPTSPQHRVVERSTVEYKIKWYKLAMQNVPAFIEESYLTTPDNYQSIYSFELASVKTDEHNFKDYTTTWEKINKMLLDHDDFGKALKRTGFMDDELQSCLAGASDDKTKALLITALIAKKIKWNGKSALTADDTKKAWRDGQGTAAEINLALVAALRESGLQAWPVALSTRSNGILNPVHPNVTDFNYVVALAVTGTDSLLLDATEPCLTPGMLPVRCLNDKGRLIAEPDGKWIDLSPKTPSRHSASYQLTITPEGNIEGTCQHNYEGYDAFSIRDDIKSAASLEAYYTDRAKQVNNLTCESFSYSGLDTLVGPYKETLKIKITDAVDLESELVLLSPLQYEATTTNPFKLKERSYPVEFPYPINETLMFNWTLPEGYVVESLPKPGIVTLPGNSARFTYNVVQNGNTIMVVSMIALNQTLFLPEEYEFIKTFFNQIITRQGEQIVIRKS